MSPRISWQPRHYVWLAILIAVAIFVIVQQLNKSEKTPIKDLTKDYSETQSGDADERYTEGYVNDLIIQYTDGPYPFVSAERKGNKIEVKYLKAEIEETLELSGIYLPEKADPKFDAIAYLNDFLEDQFIRVETETLKDRTYKFIYALNKYVDTPNKVFINIARHLISKGFVWVNEDELKDSEYKDFLLADSDVATQDRVGIYKDLKKPEKEETGN